MNPLIQGQPGTAPDTSRKAMTTSNGTKTDDSQSDLHPETGIFHNQKRQNSGPEDGQDLVTGVHEEVTYCAPSRSSGEQKNNRSTSQPPFRSEYNPATIEADQILLAFQQLANNKISANFHYNINRSSKLLKSLTTTMPMFDGNSEEFELFEDFYQNESQNS